MTEGDKELDVDFVSLSEVESLPVQWLWKPYIPIGMITILEGNPNLGKTYLTMKIAADISAGRKLPGQRRGKEGRVLLMSAEDDAAYTLKPRVEAMKGNTDNIFFANDLFFLDDNGVELVRRNLELHQPRLLVMDPLVGYLDPKVDLFRANHTRQIMSQLRVLATEFDVAILAIRHLTKGPREKAIHRGVGSMDIIAAARSGLLLGQGPDEPNLRALAHFKHNLSEDGKTRLFELVRPRRSALPQLKWMGTAEYGAEELNKPTSTGPGAPPDDRERAEEFLRSLLAGGPMARQEITLKAETKSITDITLRRAQRALGIKPVKQGKQWWWKLPEDEDAQN